MKEIDVSRLGETIVEYRDGAAWSSFFDSRKAIFEVADKVNEIIKHLNNEGV